MKKNIWIFGTIAGLVNMAWMVIAIGSGMGMDMKYGAVFGFAAMIIGFSMIFVGVKNYRDKHNQGVITFKVAFIMGFLMTLIASAVYVIVWAVEYNFFAPDFGDKYLEYSINELKAQNLDKAELESKIARLQHWRELYKNPFFFVMITLVEILPLGLVLSLVTALILKKQSAQKLTTA